jgi:hypothetical protein
MTQEQFNRLVRNSPVFPYLLSDQSQVRFQVGLVLAILQWHLPPDITYQEHCRLLPESRRLDDVKDPLVREMYQRHWRTWGLSEMQVIVWEHPRHETPAPSTPDKGTPLKGNDNLVPNVQRGASVA